MTSEIRTVASTDPIKKRGYRILSAPKQFTDWNGGKGVADKPENRRDDILLERPTLEMGNRTELDHEKEDVKPPSNSDWINGKTFWERLDSHNRDNQWQYRSDIDTWKSVDTDYKIHLIAAFVSELGLNSLQKQRAFRRFMRLDIPRATGRTETNAFLICALTVNSDTNYYGSEKVYHPQRPPENNDVHFQHLENDLRRRFGDITRSGLTKIYNKLSQGNPPTRHPAEWKGFVKRNSFVEQAPSAAPDHFESGVDSD